MFTIPDGHFLQKTGLETLVANFKASLTKSVPDDHVRYSVDAVNSRLKVEALDITELGELGKFDGVFYWPYTKAGLDVVLPYPLLCAIPYPTTFRQICGLLESRYKLHLEENDLSMTLNGPGLKMVDPVDKLLDASNGTLRLYALPTSPRFLAGTSLYLTIAPPLGPIRLNTIIASKELLSLKTLTTVP